MSLIVGYALLGAGWLIWKTEGALQADARRFARALTPALLAAIGAAVTPVLLAVPFIGPFLAIAVDLILAAIAIVAARLPADEIAHPLDAEPGEAGEALLGWGNDVGALPGREGEPWPS